MGDTLMNEDIIELEDFFNNYKKRRNEKIDVDTFIKNHNHIRYCEAVIFPNGEICNVNPSHLFTIMREIHSDPNVVYNIMPIDAAPLNWVINETNCIAVWYGGYLSTSNPTKASLDTLKKLIDKKIILAENII